MKDQKDWLKVGLTNYHITRPYFSGFRLKQKFAPNTGPEMRNTAAGRDILENTSSSVVDAPEPGSDLEGFDKAGYGPKNQAKNECLLESPSRNKHNHTIAVLTKDIQERQELLQPGVGTMSPAQTYAVRQEITRLTASLTRNMAFFVSDRHEMGKLWVASGYCRRSHTNGRLDYALLDISADRQGVNKLPSLETWRQKYDDQYCPSVSSSLLKGPPDYSIRDIPSRPDAIVYKLGALSGHTAGVFSEYKTTCKVADDAHMQKGLSSEYVFVGCEQKSGGGGGSSSSNNGKAHVFADRGDSGSVVFDKEGNLIGLLFTGQRPQNHSKGYTLVTPIEDIINDLKKLSKDKIAEIRVAR